MVTPEFNTEYKRLRGLIEKRLDDFFESEKFTSVGLGPEALESLNLAHEYAKRDGKRVRPILVVKGYELAGGKDEKRIIDASIYSELLHIYLLYHDDIMDRDDIRRGGPTAHAWYQQNKFKDLPVEEAKHHSQSMAIIDGDILEALAQKALLESNFPADSKINAWKEYIHTIINTGFGQKKDVLSDVFDVTEEHIWDVYKLKSAEYTISRPLRTGAILAGAESPELLETIIRYGDKAGVAFQLIDDEKGVKDPSELKKAKNDISEGKRTIILLKAMKKASPEQKEILRRNLGEKFIPEAELSKVLNVLTETGALAYNRKLAEEASKESQKIAVKELSKYNEKTAIFLKDFADYLVNRDR